MTIDYEPDAPPPRVPAPAAACRAPCRATLAAAAARPTRREGGGRAPSRRSAPVQAEEVRAKVETQAFQAIYAIAGRVTVPTTGEAKRVQIDEAQLDPALTVRTVPKRDQKAFLYAKVTMARGTPILPGQVSLFRDGTFVGNGRLPLLAPGEEHELGFGVDDAVRVRHAIAEEKRAETGIITSSKTDTRSYTASPSRTCTSGRSRSPSSTRSRCRRMPTSRSSCWARRRRPSATWTTSAACSPGRWS